MIDPLAKYLARKAALDTWPLESEGLDRIDQVVVIPALAESATLPTTLADLSANPRGELDRCLVVCVVNNVEDCPGDVRTDNAKTLEHLRTTRHAPLRLAVIDASCEGRELPPREGVGLARKIGMDWAVEALRRNGKPNGAIISLDADTRVDNGYLPAIRAHFERPDAWAAVIDYAHPLDDPGTHAAILCYELFLRYHELSLRWAGSPYGFHTIGSAMACTARAYAAISGMNRRRAGEDFYFLQQLAKTGPIDRIHATTVRPSPRASWRVPFGTGRRVQRYLDDDRDEYRLYHPESYRLLREWLRAVSEFPVVTWAEMLSNAVSISNALAEFLRANDFEQTWARLQQNTANAAQFLAQFHRWFDGFRTLKLIHHLRDNGYPDEDMFAALGTLVDRLSLTECPRATQENLDSQRVLLETIRTFRE